MQGQLSQPDGRRQRHRQWRWWWQQRRQLVWEALSSRSRSRRSGSAGSGGAAYQAERRRRLRRPVRTCDVLSRQWLAIDAASGWRLHVGSAPGGTTVCGPGLCGFAKVWAHHIGQPIRFVRIRIGVPTQRVVFSEQSVDRSERGTLFDDFSWPSTQWKRSNLDMAKRKCLLHHVIGRRGAEAAAAHLRGCGSPRRVLTWAFT
eukprot:COSAG06_NODE_585_length_14005_cov_13.777938_8_plen_202_part_00